jgi:parallel beta-helix repeat protein
VNAASSGATIDVCQGTYPEQVLITIPLTLTGIADGTADNPVVTVPAGGVVANATVSPRGTAYSTAAQLLIQNTSGVTVAGLSVQGTDSGVTNCNTGIVGIYYQNASGTVSDVSVQNQVGFTKCGLGLGVYVETDGTASSKVTIENNVIRFTSGLDIGATGTGTTVTISGNSVIGDSISEDNGIYVAGGATGTVSDNIIMNFTNPKDTLGNIDDGLCGIQITNSSNVTISGNTVGNTNCGISMYAGTSLTITKNELISTVDNDGIYVCGNSNLVQENTVRGSANAGIRLDNTAANSCTAFGNSNTITKNTINGSCIGVLEPAGTTGNVISPNTYDNVNLVTSASICK